MSYIVAADVEAPNDEFTWPSGITEGEKTALIVTAQERIEQVTHEKWEETGPISHLLSGDGTPTLELRHVTSWPIVSITQIEHRNEYAYADNFATVGSIVDQDDYSISDSKRVIIRVSPTTIRGGFSGLGPIWLQGHKNYKLTGTFGHVNTPEGIKRACILLTREYAVPGSTVKYDNVVSETFADGYKYMTAAGIKSGIGQVVPNLTGIRAVDIILKDFVRRVPSMMVP